MDINSEELLSQISLFPLIAQLLSSYYPKISQFISFLHLSIIIKLKQKTLKIKAFTSEKFDQLIQQCKFEFIGDSQSCALISLNTLLSLSIHNKSWLRITKLYSESKIESGWKITMPPVDKKDNRKDCLVQCICLEEELQDFVIYLTDAKLFNISSYWYGSNYCDLADKVHVEAVESYAPAIAKSAAFAGINSEYDLSSSDFEEVLNEYFVEPKYLKAGDVFAVDLLRHGRHLLSKASFYNVQNVYFKVIDIKGETDKKEYYVVKGVTNIYLNPSVHGYIFPRKTIFIKRNNLPGFEISSKVDGLSKYYDKLAKICKPFVKNKIAHSKSLFLLCGAKGCGKKITVTSVAALYGLHLIQVNCFDFYGLNPSLASGKFEQVFAKARRTTPCIVYLKNVELLGREQNYHENTRLIDIFEAQIQELWLRKPSSYPLIIIGSTELKASELVPSIARLFVYKISFEVLNLEETRQVLMWLIRNSNMTYTYSDVTCVAEKIKGYIFGDLVLLVKHAIRFQVMDKEADKERSLCKRHFDKGTDIMEAAYSDSIGAARVPKVHWNDVGGLEDLKEEIMLTLNLPIKHPELFFSGLKGSGVLFYGPPGTGKTLMAKAIATECNYNFLSVKGPELMNMYVGQSEKNVREVFERAREATPCIIFFDELDSLAPSRGKSGDSGGVTDRVVSQLLAEMDGLDKNKDVFVIAATNRPDLVDPALLRPGRFDKMFYVGVCRDSKSKFNVLKALTRRFSLASDVKLEKIIEDLPEQVTGADLYSLCSNAWFSAARKAVSTIEKGTEVTLPLKIFYTDFCNAMQEFVPSLTLEDIAYYEMLKSSEDKGPKKKDYVIADVDGYSETSYNRSHYFLPRNKEKKFVLFLN